MQISVQMFRSRKEEGVTGVDELRREVRELRARLEETCRPRPTALDRIKYWLHYG